MAKNGTSVAILGILAVIAILGLVMMLNGATGAITTPVITSTGEEACSIVDCNYGKGGIVIGEEGDFWLCGCPNQFSDRTIADWGTKSASTAREFPNLDNAWRIRKIRTY